MKKKITAGSILVNVFFILISIAFIVPFMYVVAVSLTSEADVAKYGYNLIPKHFSLDAYRYVFANPSQVFQAYKITAIFSVGGTFLSVLVMALTAYPLSKPNFKYKKIITFYIFFTMIFSGGLIPSYILNTKYLHLNNTIWVYILPSLAGGFQIIMIRTFFQQLPGSLAESAKIDGASELKIFFGIMLPLSTPVIATVSFMILISKWNDWNTSLLYINEEKLYSLQYLLQKILREAEFVKSMVREMPSAAGMLESGDLPSESMKFALAVVVSGPMLVIFPFFQKYFAGGLTIGSVKG